jgi:uncharacterized integral membrane protein
MTLQADRGRYLPLIILALVAALVGVIFLWSVDRAAIEVDVSRRGGR